MNEDKKTKTEINSKEYKGSGLTAIYVILLILLFLLIIMGSVGIGIVVFYKKYEIKKMGIVLLFLFGIVIISLLLSVFILLKTSDEHKRRINICLLQEQFKDELVNMRKREDPYLNYELRKDLLKSYINALLEC